MREQANNIDDALDKLTNTIRHIAAFSSVLRHSEVFQALVAHPEMPPRLS